MNCAYQYTHPAHPTQNVIAMPPTAVQQSQHSTDTAEYLEVKLFEQLIDNCVGGEGGRIRREGGR